jgi:flagellar assembly factor FliW
VAKLYKFLFQYARLFLFSAIILGFYHFKKVPFLLSQQLESRNFLLKKDSYDLKLLILNNFFVQMFYIPEILFIFELFYCSLFLF